MKPILSIIIISYNTADITLNCLKSISQDKGLDNIPHEIIIIDNASTDDSIKKIKQFSKTIKIISNTSNIGFAKANNQGIKLAQGEYILLLNSDIIVQHWAISQSLHWLSGHPETSACTVQLINPDGSIQPSGGFFPNIFNIFTWSLGLDDLPLVNKIIKPFHPHSPDFYTHDSFYKTNHPQDWITGAYLLVRKNILNQVNGFDESYFMYGEEVELCYRLKKANPKLNMYYLVGSRVIHLGGASNNSKASIYNKANQGLLQFFIKHRPNWQVLFVRQLLKINVFLRNTIYKLFKVSNYVTQSH